MIGKSETANIFFKLVPWALSATKTDEVYTQIITDYGIFHGKFYKWEKENEYLPAFQYCTPHSADFLIMYNIFDKSVPKSQQSFLPTR
jgi:hypothetical protein